VDNKLAWGRKRSVGMLLKEKINEQVMDPVARIRDKPIKHLPK
jgi:hypothetical protein